MPQWIWVFIIVAGGLFALKMAYTLSTAVVLPYTQGALYVTTSGRRIASFLEAVPMQPGEVLIDTGCGDGRVLRAVSRRYAATAVGYEINPLAYLLARVRCLGGDRIQLKLGNFWNADLSQGDVVFCYLYPDVMSKMGNKLASELKSGARVVSCNFPIPGWVPDQVLTPQGALHNAPIFIYRIA